MADMNIRPFQTIRYLCQRTQRRRPLSRWIREFCLHKDFHQTIALIPRIKSFVQFRHLFKINSVRYHHQWIDFARDNVVVENFVPVFVDGGLTVANEADTRFHDGADVEMIGKAGVHTSDTDAAVWANACDHLIQNFRSVGLKSYGELEGMEISLHKFTYTGKTDGCTRFYLRRIQERHQVRQEQVCQSPL